MASEIPGALYCTDHDPEHVHDGDHCCECGSTTHCCGACPVFTDDPQSPRTILADLLARMDGALDTLNALGDSSPAQNARLRGRIEGVKLARSYVYDRFIAVIASEGKEDD